MNIKALWASGIQIHPTDESPGPFQYCNQTGIAVHPNEVTCFNQLSALTCPYYGRYPVFPAYNGGMAHGSAHICHCPCYFNKSRSPARRGRGCHKYFPLLEVCKLLNVFEHPRFAFGDTRKNRVIPGFHFLSLRLPRCRAMIGSQFWSHPRGLW